MKVFFVDISGYKVSDTMRKGILQVSLYEGAEDEFMIGLLSSLGQLLVSHHSPTTFEVIQYCISIYNFVLL